MEPEAIVQHPPNSRLQICQTSTPVTPGVDASGAIKNPKTRSRRSKGTQEPEPQNVDPSSLAKVEDTRVVSQTLSPSSEVPRSQPSQEEELINSDSGITTSLGIQTPWQDADVTDGTGSSRTAEENLEASFPPIQQAQRRPRPRPSVLDTAAAQDLSLPSPSLSPVTAAANLQNRRGGYFEGSSLGETSTTPSFNYLHSQSNESTNTQWAGKERAKAEAISSTAATQEFGNLDLNNRPPEPLSMMNIPAMLDSFEAMPAEMKSYVMYQLLRRCPKPVLHFVADVVNPSLKCDFLSLLPVELGLNIVSHLDLRSLCSAARVSKKWRQIIDSDEKAWKYLFDADGYILQEGELPRAIREGWGWQHASRSGDWEKDISASGASTSDTEWSVSSANAGLSNISGVATPGSEIKATQSRRSKRKAPKTKGKSRKQQKRHEFNSLSTSHIDTDAWMDNISHAEGPYAAANAAAMAVPCPNFGLPSLKNLHLFKSLYQRHHSIRKSWMQEETKPRHIAFRAHQRHVVTCLQFDTDKILTGSDDTNINVYDTQTGALRARLEGHEGGVWALQYKGNVLVSGSTDRSVRVWDIEKGICTQVFQGHTSTVRCLQILIPTQVGKTSEGRAIMMPKQPLIITGSRDSNLRVWKLPKPGDPKFFQAGPPQDDTDCPYFVRVLTGHHHSVRAIAAHADTLVSGSYDCNVRVWKISTGETLHRLQGHTQKVYSVVLDHKRNRCISGSMDNVVKVWSLDTGSVLYNLEGHHSLVGLLDLQDDRLVSAAADSTLRIWDPESGHCKSILTAHTGAITCFQHDGQKVISGSDRTLKMWNVATGEFVKDLLTDLSGVWQVKFNQRRCVAAVQRNNFTYIEVGSLLDQSTNRLHHANISIQVLDFGAARDGVPDYKRGRRVVVNVDGQEVSDPHDTAVDMDIIDD